MIRTDNQTNPKKTPWVNAWKAGLTALLVIMGFGFSSTTKPIKTTTVADNKDVVSATSPVDFPNITIKNFGQMDERFYRGAQPKRDEYKALAALGIKTIVDLRDDPKSYEKQGAEAVRLKYVNIPMDDKGEPTEEQIKAFFSVANEAANWPFYVHCAGGRHRTGLIGAVYRYDKYGWNYEQVYKEMKNYDFYSSWGHEPIKDYVYNYYTKKKVENPFALGDVVGIQPPTMPVTEPPPPKLNE
ncbi:MAG: tyrosine-protein phosphatase [Acidobacteriota bacterium]